MAVGLGKSGIMPFLLLVSSVILGNYVVSLQIEEYDSHNYEYQMIMNIKYNNASRMLSPWHVITNDLFTILLYDIKMRRHIWIEKWHSAVPRKIWSQNSK